MRRFFSLAVIALGLAGLAVPAATQEPPSFEKQFLELKAERPLPATKAERTLLAIQAQFGFRVLNQLTRDGAKRNVSVSPGSLASVLAMFDLGVDDGIREGLIKALGFTPEEGRDKLATLRALNKALAAEKSADSPLALANALFSKGIPAKTAAKLKAEGVALEDADLMSTAGIAKINGWVSKQTRGLIPTILEKPLPRPGLAVVNALHFKDRWKFAFDPTQTKPLPFHLVEGEKVDLPMMRLGREELAIRRNEQFVAVELPYTNERFSLVVVTTHEKPASLAEFAPVADWLAADPASFTKSEVLLSLPKFEVKLTADMLVPLVALGFNTKGTLSGFGEALYIAAMPHRTIISVDESGTKAAAVTAVVAMSRSSSGAGVMRVDIDKPFMFALRDKKSGLVLMSGYVGNPAVE